MTKPNPWPPPPDVIAEVLAKHYLAVEVVNDDLERVWRSGDPLDSRAREQFQRVDFERLHAAKIDPLDDAALRRLHDVVHLDQVDDLDPAKVYDVDLSMLYEVALHKATGLVSVHGPCRMPEQRNAEPDCTNAMWLRYYPETGLVAVTGSIEATGLGMLVRANTELRGLLSEGLRKWAIPGYSQTSGFLADILGGNPTRPQRKQRGRDQACSSRQSESLG